MRELTFASRLYEHFLWDESAQSKPKFDSWEDSLKSLQKRRSWEHKLFLTCNVPDLGAQTAVCSRCPLPSEKGTTQRFEVVFTWKRGTDSVRDFLTCSELARQRDWLSYMFQIRSTAGLTVLCVPDSPDSRTDCLVCATFARQLEVCHVLGR